MTLDRITIVLPWPSPSLMPNRKNGRHWGATHSPKIKARTDGENAARHALGRNTLAAADRMRCRVTFFAPDRRRRDLDNLLASMKPYLDGIAKALGADDSIFRPVVLDDCLDKQKKGFVLVEIGGEQ